jgi:CheY-like chemotaxis protein
MPAIRRDGNASARRASSFSYLFSLSGIALAKPFRMPASAVQDARHCRTEPANVMIVEDERVSRRALAALMSANGYKTEAMASAEEALAAVNAGTLPDIALVDLDLPGMNGLDFIGRLTRLDPGVFPVLITATNGDRLASLLADRGVAFLRKPLDFDRLLSLLDGKAPN